MRGGRTGKGRRNPQLDRREVQDVRDAVRERFSAERKKPATGTEGK